MSVLTECRFMYTMDVNIWAHVPHLWKELMKCRKYTLEQLLGPILFLFGCWGQCQSHGIGGRMLYNSWQLPNRSRCHTLAQSLGLALITQHLINYKYFLFKLGYLVMGDKLINPEVCPVF